MSTKKIVLLGLLSAILFIQEQLLMSLPGIQLTFLLLVVYSKVFTLKESILIIFIHVILDNLFMGTFNVLYIIPMFIGYITIPITIKTIFSFKELGLALCSILYSIIYSILFGLANIFYYNYSYDMAKGYFISEIPFLLIIIICNFILILWISKPLINRLNTLLDNNEE